MSGNSILIDTNIALYVLSGDQDLSGLLLDKKLYVSFVTQLELLGYTEISEKEKEKVQAFLDDCVVIDINARIKEEVIKIRKSKKIKLPDSIILATSKYLNIPVMSSDKEFTKAGEVHVIHYQK